MQASPDGGEMESGGNSSHRFMMTAKAEAGHENPPTKSSVIHHSIAIKLFYMHSVKERKKKKKNHKIKQAFII